MSSASGLSFYVNIFAAARRDIAWKTPLVMGLMGLGYLALVRTSIESASDRWATSVILLILLALSYGGGVAYRRASQRIERERETGEERVQQLQTALARELHDSVAQTLSSAAMRANIVMSDPNLSPMALGQLEKIAEDCRSSAHDLRQLLAALRDEPDRTLPPGPPADVDTLRAAVNDQAERLRAEGFDVDVHFDVTKLSAARCQTLSAIAVEVGNNVVKHAKPGSRCSFSILQGDEDVLGEFSNERKDSRAARRGFGLTGVQERLALLNGTSQAIVKGGRWILQVRLPFGSDSSESAVNSPPNPTMSEESMFSRPGTS